MADNPPDSPIISNSLREELVEAFQNLLESENYVVEQTVPSDLCVDPEVFSHASFEEFAFKHTQFAKSLEEEAEKLMEKYNNKKCNLVNSSYIILGASSLLVRG